MINLIMELNSTQWVFIGAGLLMLIPSIRNLFLNAVNKVRASPKNLTSIVSKWEELNNSCIDAGLIDAQDRLHEVFLVLAKNSVDPKHIIPVNPDKGDG